MAELKIEIGEHRTCLRLPAKLTIGRDRGNRLVLPLDGVYPLHATIEAQDSTFVIQDCTGQRLVQVNGQPLPAAMPLKVGDVIVIATAKLTFTHDTPSVSREENPLKSAALQAAESAQQSSSDLRFPPGGNGAAKSEATVDVTCTCGAKYVVRQVLIGRKGKCNRCGRQFSIGPTYQEPVLVSISAADLPPVRTDPVDRKAPTAESPLGICSICQTEVAPHEQAHRCSKCELPYHRECWQENLGCATYGCANVNALKQGPEISITAHSLHRPPRSSTPQPPAPPPPKEEIPWGYLVWAICLLSFLAGAFVSVWFYFLGPLVLYAWLHNESNRQSDSRKLLMWVVLIFAFGFAKSQMRASIRSPYPPTKNSKIPLLEPRNKTRVLPPEAGPPRGSTDGYSAS